MPIRDYDQLFIGGDWVTPEGTETIGVISPVTEEVVARVPDGTEADIDKAVAAARAAFDHGPWPRMAPAERGEILRKVAAQITAEMGDMAELITREMGAPITFSNMGQVLAPTMIFNYYADLADTFAFDELRTGVLNPEVLVTKEPVGVVGAIAPWNVPLFIAAAKLAPSSRPLSRYPSIRLRCRSATTGPTSVAGSMGSPTFMADTPETTASTTSA